MKVKLKTLKQVLYEVTVPSEITKVSELKHSIEQEHGFESSSIKLLFNGIILDDKENLLYYNIKEGSTLILMTAKVQKKVEENVVEIKDNKDNKKEEVSNNNNKNKQENPEKKEDSAKNKITVNNNSNKYNDQIKQLLEMGFEDSKCRTAITAANGSVPIAIEYLSNGIPPNLGGLNFEQNEEDIDNLYSDEEGKENDEEALILHPEMFDEINLSDPNALSNIASVIKVIVKQDPAILQELLSEVEETNPEIIDFIRENDTQFKQLMSTPVNDDDYKVYQSFIGQHQHDNHQQEPGHFALHQNGEDDENDEVSEELEGEEGQDPFYQITKDFSDKDRECINNLVNMGFDRGDAIQAYIACEKNESDAANLLFQDKDNIN